MPQEISYMRVTPSPIKTWALVLLSAAFIVGCDDARSADRRVAQTIEQSRLARLKDGGAEEANSLLSKAAAESEASAATKAHVKYLLGNAQVEAALAKIDDPM